MKISLTLIYFLLSSFFVQSQTYNSSCVPSGNMIDIYRNDAYLLAIKRVNDINSPWKDSVTIPEIYIDSIARALYAINNMDYSPLKDTITTLFGYSNFTGTYFPVDSLHIHDAGSWDYSFRMKAIRITVLNTDIGSVPINDLINRYNLSATPAPFQIYPDKTMYDLTSPISLNTPALRNQFLAIAGVVYAEGNYRAGSGNSITANIVNGDIFLTYTLGCGDCPSGCTYGRIWDFKVNTSTDCSVNYLSAHNWGLIVVIPDLFPLCTPPIVPIELISIKASQKSDFNLIEWEMGMEDNVTSYIVERSTDAVDYLSIGQINITNSSPVAVKYSWKDRELIDGKIYYRIKIIDRTGAKKYSPVVFINVKSESVIRVFPTVIVNNTINIRFNKVGKENYIIDLLNVSGQKLFTTEINVNTDLITTQLKIPTVSPGMYVLSIRGKTMQSQQIVYISGE